MKMCRLFGYMGTEPERLKCALYPVRSALSAEAHGQADSWGIGFYQGEEVLLQRRPRASAGPIDFYGLLRELRTDTVVGHLRTAATGGKPKIENTDPFRFRQWLFAHHGAVERFDQLRPALLEQIPDFLRRNIRGETDSEHLFHLFLAVLHDAGKLDDPNLSVAMARQALRALHAVVGRLVVEAGGQAQGGSELNVVVTNGRTMLASCEGRRSRIHRQQGIADCAVCREPAPGVGREPRRTNHEHLRSVLVVNDAPGAEGPGWEDVPDGSIVSVTHELGVEVAPLREPPRP